MAQARLFARGAQAARSTAGFTIAELLVAIAILVLIFAIGIPSLIGYQKNIKLRTYDDMAYELYLVAQEELTNAKEKGLLVDAYSEIVRVGTPISPAAHPAGKTGLYAIDGDSFIPKLMGDTRLATLSQSGHFLIEVCPSSGQVYSVFYSETDFGQSDTTSTALPTRSKPARLLHKPLLGYYQADAHSLREADSNLTKLSVEIINEEELYLEVTGDMTKLFQLYHDSSLPAHSKLTVDLKDESKHTKQLVFNLNESADANGLYVDASNNDFAVRVLFDSMLTSTKDYDFQHILDEFTPGENITAKATFEYSNGENYVSESDSAASNSLFESNDGANITVKTVRHLRNLSERVSGFEGNKAKDDVTANKISQSGDIDFQNTDFAWKIGGDGAVYDKSATNPTQSFAPIINDNFGGSASTASFDGGNFKLSNFVVNEAGNAGIIGSANGWTIKNAHVVDPRISSTNSGPAGALVASATSCTIEDCTTYISSDHRVGVAASRTSDGNYQNYVVSGVGPSGGLVGAASGGSVSRCFSALNGVRSFSNSGGLVGSASGTEFDGCYASQFFVDAPNNAGGFAGDLGAGSTATNCFAVTEWFEGDASGFAAGFTAGTSGYASACYALVGSVNTLDSTQSAGNRFGFAPGGDEGFAAENCYYYATTGFQEVIKAKAAGESAGAEKIVEELEAIEAYTSANEGASFPYNTAGDYDYMIDDDTHEAVYPALRASALDYDGNWPDASAYHLKFEKNPPEGASIGLVPPEQTCHEGELVVLPSDKPKDDNKLFVFDRWNTAADGSGVSYAPGATVVMTGDITLYAQWVTAFHITYNANVPEGETVQNLPSDDTAYANGDTAIVSETRPSRQYYQFLGWAPTAGATSPDGRYDPEDSFTIRGDVTLYAVWKLVPQQVILNVTLDGQPAGANLPTITLRRGNSTEATFAYERDGRYTASVTNGTYRVFLRSSDAGLADIVVNNANVEANLDLYTLSVKVKRDGVDWTSSEAPRVTKFANAAQGSSEEITGTQSIVVAAGSSWDIHLSDDEGTDPYLTRRVETTTTETVNYYTVTYVGNPPEEGTISNVPTDGKIYRSGKIVTVKSNIPTFVDTEGDEWGFLGWNTEQDGSGTTYTPADISRNSFQIIKKITLYAQWSEAKYQVIYHANAADGAWSGAEPVDPHRYLGGARATALQKGTLERAHYKFIGWNTREDGSGQPYLPGDSVLINSDVDLYAQWTYEGVYTIVFDGNGAESGSTLNATFFGTATTVEIPANGFIRGDFYFRGWSTSPQDVWEEGEPQSWKYLDQVTANAQEIKALDTDGDGVIRLYAVWQYRTTYTVEFILDKMDKGASRTVAYYKTDYSATLTYEHGYNPPQTAADISIYVDNNRDGQFGPGEKLDSMSGYQWNPFTCELLIPAAAVKGDIKIVAAATSDKHILTYYLNNDEHSPEATVFGNPEEYFYSTYVAVTSEVPERTGYIFTGWNTRPEGDGVAYSAGDALLIDGNVHLYAQWKKTEVVGAFIYNYYRYNCTDVNNNTNPSGHTYGDHASDQYYFALMKGETQTMVDGETYETIDNGGQPYVSSRTFTYGVFVPKGSASNFRIYYSTNNGSSYTEVTGNSKKSGWSSLNNYSTDTRYPNGDPNASGQTAYSPDDFQYYYFTVQNGSDCVGPVTNIKIVDSSITNPSANNTCIFDFDNGKRPDFIKSSEGTAPTTRTSDWSGIAGAAPTIALHNGNVPTLDRKYANFYKNASCRSDFTVTPDANGFTYKGITLRNESGLVVTTTHNLITTNAAGTLTFKSNAMAELEPGTYVVTLDYDKDDQGTAYDNDPFFYLYVYNEGITGYRYVRLNINGVDTVAENSNNVQFSEIGFATDAAGVNPYRFEDKAVMYDLSPSGSYNNEDAYLVMDNNTRTKMCENSSTKKWTLLLDLGDGYQLNTNEYGYVSYYTAADTFGNGRSPLNFTYYGSNNASVISSKGNATGTANWTQIIAANITGSTRTGTSYANCQDYAKNETLVSPQHNNYSLTYNANGGSCPGLSNYNVSSGYGDQVLCYLVPTKTGSYFLGWSEKQNAKKADYKGGDHYNLIYNTTLYAVWSSTPPTLALTYDANFPGDSTIEQQDTLTDMPNNSFATAGTATNVSSTVPKMSGYKFMSWTWMITKKTATGTELVPISDVYGTTFTANYAAGAPITLKQNVRLYAQWKAAWHVTTPTGIGYTITSNNDPYIDKPGPGTYEFTVKPNEGWNLANVTSDGSATLTRVRENADRSVVYRLSNIRSDVTVSVEVEAIMYNVTITTDGHASLSEVEGFPVPEQQSATTWKASVQHGNAYAFVVNPDEGYGIDSVTVTSGGGSVSPQADNVTYVTLNVVGDRAIAVTSTTTPFTLSFDANGGTGSIEPMSCLPGRSYDLPSISAITPPENTTFAGWATDATAETAEYADEGSIVIRQDTTLYAVWLPSYTVTFFDSDGTSVLGTDTVISGQAATAPDTNPGAGCEFYEWVDRPGGDTDMPQGASAVDISSVENDMTVYACYKIANYSITYEGVEDATFPEGNNPTSYTYFTDEFSLHNPLRDTSRFVFLGWTGGTAGDVPQMDVSVPQGTSGNLTFTANWQRLGHMLTLQNGKGGDAYSEFVEYYASVLPGTYTAPTRDGWTLDGWYTEYSLLSGTKVLNADGTIANVVDGITVQQTSGKVFYLDEDTTLYARWKKPGQDVIYALTGDLTAGSEYMIVNRDGAGSGRAFTANNSTMSNTAVTVVAGTEASGGVPYIVDTGSYGTAKFTYTSGGSIKAVSGGRYIYAYQYPSFSGLYYADFEMRSSTQEWMYESNALRTVDSDGRNNYAYLYFNGNSLDMNAGRSPSGSCYLYEKTALSEYSLNNEVTVTLDPNGGSGSTTTTTLKPESGDTATFTFPANPTRNNETHDGRTVHYVFNGWGDVGYMAGETVDLSEDITYKAQWIGYAERTIFQKVTTLLTDRTYVIATESGKVPIINNSSSVAAGNALTEGTGYFYAESGGTYTPIGNLTFIENPANNYQWIYTTNSYLRSVSDTSRYLRRSSSTLQVSSTSSNRAWNLSGDTIKQGNNNYWIRFNNNSFSSLATNSSNATPMALYEKTTVYELYSGD